MTLETMSAAASSGPRRRSSDWFGRVRGGSGHVGIIGEADEIKSQIPIPNSTKNDEVILIGASELEVCEPFASIR